MSKTKEKYIGEDEICDMLKEGQAFVRSCYTPFIIDITGRPVRYFKGDGDLSFVEYDGKDENITQFDLKDFHERYGDFSDVYDICELGYWDQEGDYDKGEHFEEQNQIVKLDKSKK
jgi:hypothetical protein